MTESVRERAAWAALAVVAGVIAAAAIARWIWAISLGGPVLYSEGAVAHAALLSRSGLEYVPGASAFPTDGRPIFTAANYPPLFFKIAGLGDPFVLGRVASIASTLFVAGAIAWRARRAGPLVALALGAAWIATFPVTVWGAAVKPDLIALALTVGAVVALSTSPRRALIAGALIGLAVWAKPTALLPALAVAAWALCADRRAFVCFVAAVLAVALGASIVLVGPPALMPGSTFWQHVVAWNALPWSAEQAVLLVVLTGVAVGLLVLLPVALRGWRGPVAAYGLGAVGIVVLGGREGATVNYVLDLTAAAALALAGAPGLRPAIAPITLGLQLVAGTLFLDPFGVLPGRASTGAWGDPARMAVVRALPPGPALVEDSGLLIAARREPIVDDLFLWSRLHAHLEDTKRLVDPGRFEEGAAVTGAAVLGRFVAVVTEVDLEQLDSAPAYARARWHPALVEPVLARYRLDRTEHGLWVYLPK